MRDHDYAPEERALRPRSARIDESPHPYTGRAAAEGRADVLGSAGVLDLQRAVGNSAVNSLADEEASSVHEVISSGGRPLEPDVRADMEARLGHDFGDVRVHDDAAAHDSARAVSAQAYTVGSDVVFQRDKYDPTTTDGRVTLAHELTHVVQQRQGPVDGAPAPGGISVSDPGDRFERVAAANAERVAGPGAEVPATSAPAAAVQRQDESEEDQEEPPVQGAFVQREEEEMEEEPT